MRGRIPSLFLLAVACALPFLAYDVFNSYEHGAYFVVGSGAVDQVMLWAQTPGLYFGLMVALVFAGFNPHGYNMLFAHILALIANGFLYGGLIWLMLRLTKQRSKALSDHDAV